MRPVFPPSLLLSGLVGACGAQDSTGTFDALTYNIAGLPEGVSRSNPEANTPRISVRINAYDLVLVQEDFTYHHLLDAAAQHPYRSAPLTQFDTLVNDGLNRYSQSVLGPMTRERWPACFGTTDNGADCLSSKGWSRSEVTLSEGVVVHVYNHHADAGRGDADADARQRGYERLAEVINQESPDRAVIVAGDTNLHHDQANDEAVLQTFLAATQLTDACRSLACGDERIDRFMFRSGGGVKLDATLWSVAEEMVDDLGAPLSDHLAVHTQFQWSRE